MPTFETTRRVPFSAAEMYALVADVERYPEFLPLCTGLSVTSRRALPEGEELIATMSVGYKAIRERFTTRVVLLPRLPRVDVSYLDGPFAHLDNRWTFADIASDSARGPASEVRFYIDYRFKSATLGLLMGALFDQAFRKFAEAFEARARKVYARSER